MEEKKMNELREEETEKVTGGAPVFGNRPADGLATGLANGLADGFATGKIGGLANGLADKLAKVPTGNPADARLAKTPTNLADGRKA